MAGCGTRTLAEAETSPLLGQLLLWEPPQLQETPSELPSAQLRQESSQALLLELSHPARSSWPAPRPE